MLTTRSFLLTATGLLTGFAAAAQSTTATAGPQPVDILSWVTWAAAAIVLLMAIITGASVTSAAQRRYTDAGATKSATPATAATEPAAPAMQVVAEPARPAFAKSRVEEAVAA